MISMLQSETIHDSFILEEQSVLIEAFFNIHEYSATEL